MLDMYSTFQQFIIKRIQHVHKYFLKKLIACLLAKAHEFKAFFVLAQARKAKLRTRKQERFNHSFR